MSLSPSTATSDHELFPDAGSVTAVRRLVARPLQAAAFWLAVLLPFLYLPLLARGFAGQSEAVAFVALLALNVVAVVVGHGHKRGR